MEIYDVIIIGGGSAAFSAAIYTTRYTLKTLVIGKTLGGQMAEAYEIDNYPGFLSISGIKLSEKFRKHAEKLGAEIILFSEVKEISKKGETFLVKTDQKKTFQGKTIILAMGSEKRKMGIPGEGDLAGKGVSYCATCDAPFFKDKTVGVIGGGNSAVKSALLVAEYAERVYLMYRKSEKDMRAMPFWVEKARKNKKITMMFHTVPKEIKGKENVEAMVVEEGGERKEIRLDGVFVEVGSEPSSDLAKKLGVSLEDTGHIRVKPDMSTNIPGVFAAGDVTMGSDRFEQIVTACSEGSIAAESAYQYLRK